MLEVGERTRPGAMSIEQTEQLHLLAGLCRELARLGLDVGMSDAKPALSVRLGRGDPRLWVSVNVRDGFFEWRRPGGGRHAVADSAGAAQVIAVDVRRPTGLH
jgi:hypothetical protein